MAESLNKVKGLVPIGSDKAPEVADWSRAEGPCNDGVLLRGTPSSPAESASVEVCDAAVRYNSICIVISNMMPKFTKVV